MILHVDKRKVHFYSRNVMFMCERLMNLKVTFFVLWLVSNWVFPSPKFCSETLVTVVSLDLKFFFGGWNWIWCKDSLNWVFSRPKFCSEMLVTVVSLDLDFFFGSSKSILCNDSSASFSNSVVSMFLKSLAREVDGKWTFFLTISAVVLVFWIYWSMYLSAKLPDFQPPCLFSDSMFPPASTKRVAAVRRNECPVYSFELGSAKNLAISSGIFPILRTPIT